MKESEGRVEIALFLPLPFPAARTAGLAQM